MKPAFDTHLAPPMSDAEKNRRDALLMLDNLNDYGMSSDGLIDELKFNFDYDDKEATTLYWEWMKVQA